LLQRWSDAFDEGNGPDFSPEQLECPPRLAEELKRRIEENRVGGNMLVDLFGESEMQESSELPPDTHPRQDKGNRFILERGNRPIPSQDWVLEKPLGKGTFGEVWKAHDETRKRDCVFKFCLQDSNTLRNEVRLLDRIHDELNCPGIVALQETHLRHEIPFLQYEFVDGLNLREVLTHYFATCGPVPPIEAAEAMLRLSESMAFAHELGDPIAHRDLKPDNILISNYSEFIPSKMYPLIQHGVGQQLHAPAMSWLEFKIADFGLGATDRSGYGRANAVTSLGPDYDGAGTRAYMSPEQWMAQPANIADDVFALGVIWYELLVGEQGCGPPTAGWKERLSAHGVPDSHATLIESCLTLQANRIADAGQLATSIRSLYPPYLQAPLNVELAKLIWKTQANPDAAPSLAAEVESFYEKHGDSLDYTNGLTSLSIEVVEALIESISDMSFGSVTSLSVDVAEKLAKTELGSLYFDSLPSLSIDVAKRLAQCGYDELGLDGITSLSVEVAEALARAEYDTIYLNGITSLSVEVAEQLSLFKARKLYLNGITSLPTDVAVALFSFLGEALYLNGLISLDVKVAEALSKFEGELHLNGVTSLSVEVAEALEQCRGEITGGWSKKKKT
jgi:serine/threonine protein kinase